MPNPGYLGYPFVVDARLLMSNAFNYLRTKITGWQPSEGQLEVWTIEAMSGEMADVGTLVSQVPKAIFRYLGTLYGILPIQATAAQTTSTWTLSDSLGHTILAGTQVSIADGSGNQQPFTVISDVIVPAGQSATTAGQVHLVAVFPGSASNAIGTAAGTINLLDSLAWVTSIAQVATTTGGVDAESDDDYLSRLAVKLQTVSPRPILPNDFAILARDIAGVQRAVAIDGYNPADGSFNNERYVTVVSLDSLGAGVSLPIRTEVQDYLDSLREINFVVATTDPVVTLVDVTTTFHTLTGWAVADVEDLVLGTINDFLDSSVWGIQTDGDNPANPITWNNTTVIRYNEFVTAISNTQGVDYVDTLTFGEHGSSQAAADLTLTGVVPLPTPGPSIVVTGS